MCLSAMCAYIKADQAVFSAVICAYIKAGQAVF